ncbi:hypothetical protein THAOC_15340 [Thalassiosira oceanica]|uniref:Uncharacterized protein n=1 Tax=Thalassiosira oceanica TaxID=159749 RepID=K0SG48_THAOC|nr:hypothetical protein THAOC_15340 [Thalassiosira oceanica]|eukprot:EJK63974.1 hypothetical protein THAOC_15340 [Thalassiosira oceanica]
MNILVHRRHRIQSRHALKGRRPRDAAQFPASGTPSPALRLVSDHLGGLDHWSTTSRRALSHTPVLDARRHPSSAGEVAVIRHRAPLTPEIEKAPPQPEVRHTDPNQAQLPPSQGIRRSPRPVRRPSADPVLAQPTIFASSDVAVFLSACRDEASANDTPGSQYDAGSRLSVWLSEYDAAGERGYSYETIDGGLGARCRPYLAAVLGLVCLIQGIFIAERQYLSDDLAAAFGAASPGFGGSEARIERPRTYASIGYFPPCDKAGRLSPAHVFGITWMFSGSNVHARTASLSRLLSAIRLRHPAGRSILKTFALSAPLHPPPLSFSPLPYPSAEDGMASPIPGHGGEEKPVPPRCVFPAVVPRPAAASPRLSDGRRAVDGRWPAHCGRGQGGGPGGDGRSRRRTHFPPSVKEGGGKGGRRDKPRGRPAGVSERRPGRLDRGPPDVSRAGAA